MKKTLISLITLTALVACSNDDDFSQVSTTQDISITATITPQTSRVATSGLSSIFEVNDAIMVYGWVGDNTTAPSTPPIASVNTLQSDNTWSAIPQMLWQSQTDQHYFLGIYPARTVTTLLTDAFTLDETNQEASDILVAQATLSATFGNSVPLVFDHLMAKISINMNFRDQFGVTSPIPSQVKLFCDKAAKINYLTRAINVPHYTYDPNKYISMPQVGTNAGYEASYTSIAIPQQGVRRVEITIDGKVFKYESTTDISLISGTITTLNLNVGRDKITLAGVSVSDWTTGDIIVGGEAEEIELFVQHNKTK